jgi:hypothetical protein
MVSGTTQGKGKRLNTPRIHEIRDKGEIKGA